MGTISLRRGDIVAALAATEQQRLQQWVIVWGSGAS